jgi:hypothetical protein
VATAHAEAHYNCWNMGETSENAKGEDSDLEKFAAILLRHGVEFLVVGGQ